MRKSKRAGSGGGLSLLQLMLILSIIGVVAAYVLAQLR
jgi:Tfp pilus assembly protein FimT